ncbi:hypothetical protein, partial [Algoriphagus sp.]|uniref:hypothetical protein n=1 Tax=Algoriphagus sp. TaxID=1872435 RepID=UPI00391AA8FD
LIYPIGIVGLFIKILKGFLDSLTVCGFAKAGLLRTTVHLKTTLQLYEKTVNRSTAPPLLQNRC